MDIGYVPKSLSEIEVTGRRPTGKTRKRWTDAMGENCKEFTVIRNWKTWLRAESDGAHLKQVKV